MSFSLLVGLYLAGSAFAQQATSPYHALSRTVRPPSTAPVVSSSTPTPARWMAPAPRAVPRPGVVRPRSPVAARAGGIQAVRYQVDAETPEEQRSEYRIQLEPPGLERIAQSMQNDLTLQERMRQEAKNQNLDEHLEFPEEPILSRDTYRGRGDLWPMRNMVVEPYYVCYEPLLFQDVNSERYGWDFGIIHPLYSVGKFYYDLALLPMHCVNWKCQHDCSTGYCLPGDPVPFMFYPPELSLTGTVAEVAVILALVAIFP